MQIIHDHSYTKIAMIIHSYRMGSIDMGFDLFFKDICRVIQDILIHWDRDKMADIPEMIFSNSFSNEDMWISTNISLKFVPEGHINDSPALVQIMVWRWLNEQ